MLLSQIFFAVISTYHQLVRNSDYIKPALKKISDIKIQNKYEKQGSETLKNNSAINTS